MAKDKGKVNSGQLISHNADQFHITRIECIISLFIDLQLMPRGTVVLCGAFCGSCSCHPMYQSSVSHLFLTLKKCRKVQS